MQTDTEVVTDVAHYEQQVKEFETIHEGNLESALVLVNTFKKNAKELDEIRTTENEPHNAAVKATNAKYTPAITFCKRLADAINQRVCAFRDEQERKALEAQRLEIERANKEREEQEALARIAQEEADKQREQGNVEMAEVVEAQAQTLELEAALTMPKVVAQQPKTYALPGGGSVNYRKVQDWTLPGFRKEDKMPADSPIFAKVDLKDLRRFLIVDPVKVNAILKAEGKLPAPFVLTVKHVSTSR